MKVNELIERLEELADADFGETEVHFAYNYGDHWRTVVAPEVKTVRVEHVKMSGYHRMPVLKDEDNETKQVVVIQ